MHVLYSYIHLHARLHLSSSCFQDVHLRWAVFDPSSCSRTFTLILYVKMESSSEKQRHQRTLTPFFPTKSTTQFARSFKGEALAISLCPAIHNTTEILSTALMSLPHHKLATFFH